MTQIITLPPGAAIAILAFILSLVPAGFFLWLWYLRRHDRAVPGGAVATGLLAGMAIVPAAFYLEKMAAWAWHTYWPTTSYYFHGAVLPLQSFTDVLMPAIGTFVIVATVEEGLRYIVLSVWYRFSRAIDQVFDGLVIGIATGLGFATIENTIYFWNLFSEGSFDTLVFVFFLRFLISTLAHICFGGIMGVYIARGTFSIYRPKLLLLQGFLLPWFLHGLFDLLLGINNSSYAVFLLIAPIVSLIFWAGRRDFFVINRVNGRIIVGQQAPTTHEAQALKKFLKRSESPWNSQAPWLGERRVNRSLLRNMESNA